MTFRARPPARLAHLPSDLRRRRRGGNRLVWPLVAMLVLTALMAVPLHMSQADAAANDGAMRRAGRRREVPASTPGTSHSEQQRPRADVVAPASWWIESRAETKGDGARLEKKVKERWPFEARSFMSTRWCHMEQLATEFQNASSPLLRVYMYEDPGWTWGPRLCSALRRFAPLWVCWSRQREEADVEIAHVDDAFDVDRTLNRTRQSPPFAVLQHSYHFSSTANRDKFSSAWTASILVASFQDLSEPAAKLNFSFHGMPWGADESAFYPLNISAAARPYDRQPRAADLAGKGMARSNPLLGMAQSRLRDESRLPELRPYVAIVGVQDVWAGDVESHKEVILAAAHANLRVRHIGDK